MKKNVGTFDQLLRIAAGLVLLWLAFTQTLGPWAYIGIVPLLTGVLGYCPLYQLLGIRTCRTRDPL